jgi:hypothetical protein
LSDEEEWRSTRQCRRRSPLLAVVGFMVNQRRQFDVQGAGEARQRAEPGGVAAALLKLGYQVAGDVCAVSQLLLRQARERRSRRS